jgi:hypothetical protein
VWRDAGDLSAEEMARNAARLPPVLSTVLPRWTPDKETDISCEQTKFCIAVEWSVDEI